MNDILLLLTGAIVVNHFVLTQFPGVRAFTSAVEASSGAFAFDDMDSMHLQNAATLAAMTTFVVTLTCMGGYLLYHYLLLPFDLAFMHTFACILLVAASVGIACLALQKIQPALYRLHGVVLALTAANGGVLSVALVDADRSTTLVESGWQGIGAGLVFSLIVILFSAMRARVQLADVPAPFRGPGITLVTAALMSLAFMGFAGLV
jgi:electron transport complex protein RnfA